MPGPQRRQPAGLIDQLLDEPHRFGFFQAVRLLELALPDAQRPASALVPRQLRFRNTVSLSFPASEIESLRVERSPVGAVDGDVQGFASIERIDLTPAFMGLLGINGSLPLVYTEQIAQREAHHKDAAARGFLDVFSHRAVSLFYAAWKKHRLAIQYEQEPRHRFLPWVLALAGVGTTALQDRLHAGQGGVADESLAFFAGALQQRQRSAPQIERVLARYLGVPVRIEQFQGRWYQLPASARTSLGMGNGVLGSNAIAGERVWQRDLRVKLTLGALDHAMFQRFLPGGPGATALKETLTMLSGVSLEYEVHLRLKADAVQGHRMDSARAPRVGRLGWDTYLQTRPQRSDRCDVRYDIHGAMPA
jgi:type VI secretion system protein ImpH